MCYSLNFCDFSELCQFCCSAGVLPTWCVYTHWHRGKTEKGQSPECFKIFEKNTIFNEHPVSPWCDEDVLGNIGIEHFGVEIFNYNKQKHQIKNLSWRINWDSDREWEEWDNKYFYILIRKFNKQPTLFQTLSLQGTIETKRLIGKFGGQEHHSLPGCLGLT